MTATVQLNLRIPAPLREQLDARMKQLEAGPYQWPRPTLQSEVIRILTDALTSKPKAKPAKKTAKRKVRK